MRRTSGISLLLLIFLSLCLMTFSLLSISESAADRNLSQKSAERTLNYYEAVTEANQVLHEVDEILGTYLREACTEESAADAQAALRYLALCSNISDALPEVTWSQSDDTTGTISFSVPVTDTQRLSVALRVCFPEHADDTLWQISAWQIVNTKEWKPDTSQHLYRIEH